MYCERFKETMTNESITNSPGRTCTVKVLMILSTINREVRFCATNMQRTRDFSPDQPGRNQKEWL